MRIDRRTLLATAAAALASPAIAQTGARSGAYTIPDEHMPKMVRIKDSFAPGEIHVDPGSHFLYWTLTDARAIRYKVGVARASLYTPGTYVVGAKKEWPAWTPTAAMIKREPGKYARYADGMPGGPKNPLGARALYLFDGGRDTFLRIHGTPQPWTVGTSGSNGCVRLVNSHVEHLYEQVPKGTRVVLHG
ncbi:MAG: L,D-transpeptidase [Shimia sp.]